MLFTKENFTNPANREVPLFLLLNTGDGANLKGRLVIKHIVKQGSINLVKNYNIGYKKQLS